MNEEWIPLAVKFGIDIEEFYTSNPKRLVRRLPFYEERVRHNAKTMQRDINLVAWLNGLYVAKAISGLSGKAYPTEPVEIFDNEPAVERISEEEAEERQRKQEEQAADGFRAFAFLFNRDRKKRKEVQDVDGEH